MDGHASEQPSPAQASSSTPTPLGSAISEVVERIDWDVADARHREHQAEMAEAERRSLARDDAAQKHCLMKGLGPRYAACTLLNFYGFGSAEEHKRQRAVVDRLQAIRQTICDHVTKGRGLFFYGPPGTGKDHLAAAMLRAVVDGGFSARWIQGADLYALCKRQFQQDQSDDDVIRVFCKPAALCISDPLIDESTSYDRRTFRRLVHTRYDRCLSTWVTVNVASTQEAIDLMGDQVFSRLMEGTEGIFCHWSNYRRRKS